MCAHYSARACARWLRDSIQSHKGGMISSQVHSYGLGDDLDSYLANVVGDIVNKSYIKPYTYLEELGS